MVTVAAGETKIIEVNVSNSYGSSLYYGAWYEILSGSSSDIELGLYTEEDNTPSSGTLASGASLTLLVGISNNGSSNALVNIGTIGSLTSSLGLTSLSELGSLTLLKVPKMDIAYTTESTIPVRRKGALDSLERFPDEPNIERNMSRIMYEGTIPTELKI
jgi:hypothetical protein